MRVLLLGANGFIGSELAAGLASRGHHVVGLTRPRRHPPCSDAVIEWVGGDLNRLLDPVDWRPMLGSVEAVVNASGALQDGYGDRLERTQHRAIVALIEGCERAGIKTFVQISAPGAAAHADTAFMRTKAAADLRLARSTMRWAILRPGLVIGRNAYGGTALIRMLAALPVQGLIHAQAAVQCVGIEEVGQVVALAVEGALPHATDLDLVEPEPQTLAQVVAEHRRWLGLAPARFRVGLPAAFATPLGMMSDLAGLAGWRPPSRTTALRLIARGITADGGATARLGLPPCAPLGALLARHRAGVQDRWAAWLTLTLPFIVLSLSALWIGSGIAGLRATAAAADLIGGGAWSRAFVRFCSLLDVALGLALLIRSLSRAAAAGMVIVTSAYVAGASLLAPALWSDPLAPLLKAVTALVLALVGCAVLDRR